ncbi:MAG TPA: LysR family transcriptional regulator [Deltaproteobacteria bacterium]|nr:LysR family transcriptional regulator [Deltaproteobacteria bacterium]
MPQHVHRQRDRPGLVPQPRRHHLRVIESHSQATLSRHIAALEESLGMPLFDRTRRGLVPTDAARALLPHAEAMAASAGAGLAAIEGLCAEPSGGGRVAVPPPAPGPPGRGGGGADPRGGRGAGGRAQAVHPSLTNASTRSAAR